MAVLWKKKVNGTRYEVRTAGQARRLYTDGVFHSQYNPASPLTGDVWDLLMLPALFYPAGEIRRVLVLGVGGGAVIRQLQHLIAPDAIVGVELNPLHLYVARRFFGVRQENVTLVEADAVQWVRDYQGPPFDMIIDDLFGEWEGEPVRAVAASPAWFGALLKHLTPRGLLVANFIAWQELKTSAYFTHARTAARFRSAFKLTAPRIYNNVAAFLRRPVESAALRQAIKALALGHPVLKSPRLKFYIRRLG